MGSIDRVIWSEGMFLKPQHFQQLDRHYESQIIDRPSILNPHNWGITHLEIDETLLLQGKFAITVCRGLLPDGTAFNVPTKDVAPKPLEIPAGTVNQLIYLTLPLRRAGVAESSYDNENGNYRYKIETTEITDDIAGTMDVTEVQIGKLALSLKLESEDLSAYTSLGIAKVVESRADLSIHLDKKYIPTCLDIYAVPQLIDILNEIKGLLQTRGNILINHLGDANAGNIAEITDFLLLQVINRYEPLIGHLASSRGLHPKELFIFLLQLMGELATFTNKNRRPIESSSYLHHDLKTTFSPLVHELQKSLSRVFEESATAIKLEEQQHGTWIATLHDKTLLTNSYFILAVYAQIPLESVRKHFPVHTKVAPTEQLRNLVNRALPGIDLDVLPVAPREIPYHANYTYFSLNKEHPLFQQLTQSAAIAFHIGGDFPGLELELWAIKE